MWATAPDWLLHALVALLCETDAYRLWLVAVECELPALCDFLQRRSPFAPLDARGATHMAMVHGCWRALCELSNVSHDVSVGRYRLPTHTVQRVLRQLRGLAVEPRLSIPPHPQRRLAMLTAAAPGSVPPFVIYEAARHGHLESVAWLHHVAEYEPAEALEIAARHGRGPVVAWILAHGGTPPRNSNPHRRFESVQQLRTAGGIEITSWVDVDPRGRVVHMVSPQWGFASRPSGRSVYPIADIAAKHGDLAAVQQILALPAFASAYSRGAVDNAAVAGHLHVLKWFKATHRDAFDSVITLLLAVGNGHVQVAEWLVANRLGGSSLLSLSDAVGTNGDLLTLQWIMTRFLAVQPFEVALHAARAGQLHILQWLVENADLRVPMLLVRAAADRGHVAVVQWLLARCKDDEVDVSLLLSATSSGNCSLVQWLVETYKIWDPILFSRATRTASITTLAYLYDQGELKARELEVPLASVLRVKREDWVNKGQYETLTWLLRRGFREGILNKRSFDHMIAVERAYARQQQLVGWTHEFMPCVSVRERAQFCEMVETVIAQYDPATLIKVPWLPCWAVAQRSLTSLRRLREIRHPQLLARKTFRFVLRATNDEPMVKWFVLQKPSLFSPYVVSWAVKWEHRSLMQWILDEFVPARVGSMFDSSILEHCQRIAATRQYQSAVTCI